MLYQTQNTLDSGQVLKEIADINSSNINSMRAVMSGNRNILNKFIRPST